MAAKRLAITLLAALVLPLAAVAEMYNDDNLPYADVNASWDLRTRVAVSTLTDVNVLRGNDDGAFAPFRTLNRAEFMAIVIRLSGDVPRSTGCFPDVSARDWFADAVCQAKTLGIVRGYPDDMFHPERPVQYEEALKILVRLFGIPEESSGREWYERYLHAAIHRNVELPEGYPGLRLTREQTARLTAAFLADSRGELEEYRRAESGEAASRSSVSRSSQSSLAPQSSVRSDVGSSSSLRHDPDADVSLTSHIILLGTTSPVLGSISIFPNQEPLDVTKISVDFVTGVESIDALEIYRGDGSSLGRATYDSTDDAFVLRISTHALQVDRRTSAAVYVRAIVNAEDGGGWSGESVQIDDIFVQGDGMWSDTRYSQTTSETFPESLTARAKITRVANAGATTEILVTGMQIPIGSFRIAGTATDARAGVNIQSLQFQISKTTEVAVSNVIIGASDTNVTSSCSIASSILTCSSLPAALADIDDGERVLKLYGDVSLASGTNDALLQLLLSNPGGPSSTGSITWNDTEAVFTWVDKSAPLVRGTAYTR